MKNLIKSLAIALNCALVLSVVYSAPVQAVDMKEILLRRKSLFCAALTEYAGTMIPRKQASQQNYISTIRSFLDFKFFRLRNKSESPSLAPVFYTGSMKPQDLESVSNRIESMRATLEHLEGRSPAEGELQPKKIVAFEVTGKAAIQTFLQEIESIQLDVPFETETHQGMISFAESARTWMTESRGQKLSREEWLASFNGFLYSFAKGTGVQTEKAHLSTSLLRILLRGVAGAATIRYGLVWPVQHWFGLLDNHELIWAVVEAVPLSYLAKFGYISTTIWFSTLFADIGMSVEALGLLKKGFRKKLNLLQNQTLDFSEQVEDFVYFGESAWVGKKLLPHPSMLSVEKKPLHYQYFVDAARYYRYSIINFLTPLHYFSADGRRADQDLRSFVTWDILISKPHGSDEPVMKVVLRDFGDQDTFQKKKAPEKRSVLDMVKENVFVPLGKLAPLPAK